MEAITLSLRPERYHELVFGESLPDAGEAEFALLKKATAGGNPGVVLTHVVELPDGSRRRAQMCTTLALLETAVKGLRAAADSPHSG